MGGKESQMYGSPYGGATMTRQPQYEIESTAFNRMLKQRPSEDVPVEQEIELRFFQRIINDLLKGKIDPEALRRLPDVNSINTEPIYFNPTT